MTGSVLAALTLSLLCINIHANETEFCAKFHISKCTVPGCQARLPRYQKILQNASCYCLNTMTGSTTLDDERLTFRYPVYAEGDMLIVKVVDLPAPVVIAVKPANHGKLRAAINSLTDIWTTLALCVVWAIISGIVVWILDHRVNSDQFPTSFLDGVKEATWWAIVTMTTVGYGDKTPKSVLARAYSAFWMLVGIIMLSMLTAQISSTLTTQDLKDPPIRKVGVLLEGLEFFDDMSESEESYMYSFKGYENQLALTRALDKRQVDAIVAYYCDDIDVSKYHVIPVRLPRHDIGISEEDSGYECKDDDLDEEYFCERDWDELRDCLQKRAGGNKKQTGSRNKKNRQKACAYLFRGKSTENNIELQFTWLLLAGSVAVLVFLLLAGVAFSKFNHRAQVDNRDDTESRSE